MQRRLRLLELLSFAKGPSDKAGQTINIVRGPRTDICGNNGESTSDEGGFISLRLSDTLRGEEKANPYVQAGDIVTIPEAEQVYIVGNVYGPTEDVMLQPNDIVEVPESTGKSVIRSLLGAVAPSVAQLPVRVIP